MKAYEVEIIKVSSSSYWYRDKVGEKYFVEKNITDYGYRLVNPSTSFIQEKDCKILREVGLEQQWTVVKEYPKTIDINGYEVQYPLPEETPQYVYILVSDSSQIMNSEKFHFTSNKEANKFFNSIVSLIK